MAGLHILYIDDDPDEHFLLETCLEEALITDFELVAVGDTGSAEEALAAADFDLIISDNQLKGSDKHGTGSAFLHHLLETGNRVPKLLFTAAGMDALQDNASRMIESGEIAFVPKAAMTPEVLQSLLAPILDAQRATESNLPETLSVVRPVLPYADFLEAAESVVEYFHRRYGYMASLIARTEDDDWVVLYVHDDGYGVRAGDVYRWSDTFCSRMYEGRAPMVVPDVSREPALREAPVARNLTIGSYVGVPICRADGTLFGTLCAIDPEPGSERMREELPQILFESRNLGTILDRDLRLEVLQREKEKAEVESMTDGLTGAYNRKGWDALLEAEERRCQRYGHPGSVIMVDLDGLKQINDTEGHEAGDRLIVSAAEAMTASLREEDVLARLGGDEFAVLAVECNAKKTFQLIERIYAGLATAGVQASLGWAARNPKASFQEAIQEADAKMYANKRQRKSASSR